METVACLIFARGATNIGIAGRGTIDGRGAKEHFPNPGDRHRPMLIRFMECVNVRVSNCTFDTRDDSICLQASRSDHPCRDVVITNCIFVSQWAGIRIGLLSVGDFENIAVSNCIFRDINDAGLKIQMCEGGTMRNLVFSNLVMHRVPRPVFMTFNRWRMGVDTPQDTPPMKAMGNMTFSNIRVDNSELQGVACGIILTGVPGHYIENIAFDNLDLTLPGGGKRDHAQVPDLPTLVDRRPEFGVFGNQIPFAGIYARQVRDLHLSNVRIAAVGEESRPAVIGDDVVGFSISGLRISETFSGPDTIYLRDVQNASVARCCSSIPPTRLRRSDGAFVGASPPAQANAGRMFCPESRVP